MRPTRMKNMHIDFLLKKNYIKENQLETCEH